MFQVVQYIICKTKEQNFVPSYGAWSIKDEILQPYWHKVICFDS